MGQIHTSSIGRIRLPVLVTVVLLAAVLLVAVSLVLLRSHAVSGVPEDVRFDVVDRQELGGGIMRLTLRVRLNRPVSTDVLRAIAAKLKASESRLYNNRYNIFIFYYLPGMRTSGTAWALSHFTPELEVEINGLSPAEYASLSQPEVQPGQSIVGVWLDESPFVASRITIYKEGERLYLNQKFKDGSGHSEEVTSTDTPRGTKFQTSRMSGAGEYYLMDQTGDLQLWDNDGPGDTAKSVRR